MRVMVTLAYLVIGLVTGVLTRFAGASAVVVPALMLFLHMPFLTAVGTSLAGDVVTSHIIAWSYTRQHHVQLRKKWTSHPQGDTGRLNRSGSCAPCAYGVVGILIWHLHGRDFHSGVPPTKRRPESVTLASPR